MSDSVFSDVADDGSFTVTVSCGGPNGYDGRLGIRISSIFVIGFGSMLGAFLPVILARQNKVRVPKLAFFIAKYFGSGVIIATAFIHLLAPADEALGSPCLQGAITDYSWPEGIALMTVMLMFFIELMAARFEFFGQIDQDDLEKFDPSLDLVRKNTFVDEDTGSDVTEKKVGDHKGAVARDHADSGSHGYTDDASISAGGIQPVRSNVPGRDNDISYPPGGADHLAHQKDHRDDAEHFAAQMTAIFILEFGVIFHSIFIGLTLAVAGDEFNILYIVLVFHQTFEGLGLGSRLATAQWPRSKAWMPYVLAAGYGIATPLAIAIGLGVKETFSDNSMTTMVVNGVFDSISAGILIYTGLVELMAHEFMFNREMRRSNIKVMLGAFLCMCLGAGLMALLGKWA